MRISLGIPTRGEVNIETTMALMYMLKETPHEFHLNFHKGTYLNELRNDILKDARDNNADYLMFIDSDLTFPPDGINRLLASYKDVIGGIYNMKQLPPVSTLKMIDKDGKIIGGKAEDIPKDKIFKAYAIPTGFMLIRLEAIKDIKNPFDFSRDEKGEFIGEDVGFCEKVREAGLDIWCDPTIPIGHIGSYMY